MQGQTPIETIALTPAGRAALEQELQRLRTEHVPGYLCPTPRKGKKLLTDAHLALHPA
jgi:hypothetical protein